MCYKVFRFLTAWKSVWELMLSLHCCWGAGTSCCTGYSFLLNQSVYSKTSCQVISLGWLSRGPFGSELRARRWGMRNGQRSQSVVCWKGSLRVQHADTGSPNAVSWTKTNGARTNDSCILWITGHQCCAWACGRSGGWLEGWSRRIWGSMRPS